MNGTSENRDLPVDAAGWRAFFAFYRNIILVANSDAVDIDALKRTFGDGSLFVFFNKTYKVLAGPFDRPSLLVARSSEAGANIVYRREVGTVVRPFEPISFRGILNLRAAEREAFSPAEAFEGRPIGFLDLSGELRDIYPNGRIPSSGFALALWLAEQRLEAPVHLAGFSAKRSERWKLFAVHDWTFEQTAQRMLVRAGLLRIAGEGGDDPALVRLAERFPEIAADRLALAATEVLGERLANTDAAVDRLLSLTRWQRRLESAFRSLKPKTRKERLAEAFRADERSSGLAKKPRAD